jgi:hypothetical protein
MYVLKYRTSISDFNQMQGMRDDPVIGAFRSFILTRRFLRVAERSRRHTLAIDLNHESSNG